MTNRVLLRAVPDYSYDSGARRYDRTKVNGAVLEPLGIRVRQQFSGSGWVNSDGTSEIRSGEWALKLARQIAKAVNAAGGIEDSPYMREYLLSQEVSND